MPQAKDEAGNIWETDAQGNAVRLVSRGQAPRPAQQMPADPTFTYKAPQAAAALGQTNASAAQARASTVKTAQETQQDGARFDREQRQYPISKEDAAIIDRMRQASENSGKNLSTINEAQRVVDRFKTGPDRAKLLQYAVPQPEDNILTSMGKSAVGLFTNDQDEKDYQYLQSLSSGRILDAQVAQKGPQTESDARRLGLSEVSADKPTETNALILGRANLNELLSQQRPGFYGDWARRYGSLTAADENGNGVDAAWNARTNQAYQHYQNDPRIKRLTGLKNAPRKPAKVIDYNDWNK